MFGLYRYFNIYENEGCSLRFWKLIEAQFDEYDAVELEYWQEEIEKESSWRIGLKAEYLRMVELIVLSRLQRQRDRAQVMADDHAQRRSFGK